MYRPDQRRSCCPHYTIRLDSSKFKPSRAQRQTINRFNKYVIGDSYAKGVARLRPLSRDQAKKRDNHFDLVERIHEAEDAKLLKPLEAAHKLEVTLEHDDFTEEKFSVYENYQRVVHKDKPSEITRNGFKGFLCDSPLRRETIIGSNGCERRLGSYHQCYRLDGKLVAIGVLDLLPECVSSVYFLYDESIHKHAPGKIGALYEIALAIEKGYGWWYPGFYIHSCPKMRYKIDYSPQFVLDPVALSWDPLDREVLDLLDKKAFVSMLEERQAKSASVLHSSKDAISGAETSDGPGRSASLTNMPDEDNKDGMDDMGDEEDEDDEDNIWLFNSKMPGITPFSTIVALDMDHIRVKIAPKGPLYQTSDLVIWEEQDVEQWPGLKASVAELVATIGPDLMDQICLDFIPHRR
ncbi:arginine-tRNA-protein transferase [Dactylonectria estremocensis]|uniref:Arginyl-tRNA--protein transferase 1 n=1 Tax=Dactylonectria estremocensis TaxID=1079267 RepID=A0A9P9E8Y4_9HYPO|nr:arginine-tRNA-protein transferase [Dactylonectria estremocensis]